jgi:hypothetical protein
MDCVNLCEHFGKRYQITWDPAYEPRHVPRDKHDPWMMQIPCRSGTIYPFGGSLLALELDGHSITAGKVAAIQGVRLHQDGDRERTFVFDASLFGQIAAIVQPKRRRTLSPEHKAKLLEAVRPFSFRSRASNGPTFDGPTGVTAVR